MGSLATASAERPASALSDLGEEPCRLDLLVRQEGEPFHRGVVEAMDPPRERTAVALLRKEMEQVPAHQQAQEAWACWR